MNRRSVGSVGEHIACEYLLKHNFLILETNIDTPFGEVDILAMSSDRTIVYVEVRTRNSNAFSSPAESITPTKLRHMTQTAQYVHRRRFLGSKLRLDLISVKNGKVSAHLQNIELS